MNLLGSCNALNLRKRHQLIKLMMLFYLPSHAPPVFEHGFKLPLKEIKAKFGACCFPCQPFNTCEKQSKVCCSSPCSNFFFLSNSKCDIYAALLDNTNPAHTFAKCLHSIKEACTRISRATLCYFPVSSLLFCTKHSWDRDA